MLEYIATLVLILMIWVVLKYLKWRRDVYCHLEKIGGPKAYPIIGNLNMFSGAKRSDYFNIYVNLFKEYGPNIFRTYNMFTPEVYIMKPEHLEQIMTSSVHTKKGRFYWHLKGWLGDGLLLSDGAKWHQRRKMITPTFHFKILEHFMVVFVEKSKLLVEQLQEKSDGESFDIYPYITHCALDIICETAMGVSTNAMADKDSSYAKAIYRVGELIFKKQIVPLQQTPLYPLMKDGKDYYKYLNILHGFTHKVIADRKKMIKENPIKMKQEEDDFTMSKKKRLSFLDLLLDASDKLSESDIREEVDTFMFEGHDTTTAAIIWNLLLLGLNPEVQEKVYEEIKSVLYERRTPETLSDLNEMKYLECCIKETMRLYPSVPLISRYLTEDITIDGKFVPEGTDCYLNIYHVQRDPDIYPDPEKYDPDRFLPENSRNRHPYAYVPFSAGPRNCIGQKFAMYEEKTILASILRTYKVIPIDTLKTMNMVFELVLRPENGLRVALQKRTD